MSSTTETVVDYDIVHEQNELYSKKDFKNLKSGEFEFDLEKSEKEAEEEKQKWNVFESKEEKKMFFKNLLASPYPKQDGDFAGANTFQDRIRLMEPIQEGLLYKTMIRAGSGPKVTEKDAILFHMNAFQFDCYDEPFDSTFARKKALLARLHHILQGYALALLTMQAGELAEFAVHRSLAYGELGCPPRIPPHCDIIVVLEVMEVHSEGSVHYYHSLSKEEQQKELTSESVLSMAHQERITGNENYSKEDYHKAMICYKRAIDLLEKNFMHQSTIDSCQKLLLSLYQNIANCYLKLNRFNSGSVMCYYSKRALRIDSRSAKANYLMGMGLLKLGKHQGAKPYLLAAHRARPSDVSINEALELLNHKLNVDHISTTNMYKRMFRAIDPNVTCG